MTNKNIKSILALLIANYPNSFKNVEKQDMDLIFKTWETQFKNYTLDDVFNAIMAIIANDTSGFAPSIGKIKDELNKKYKDSVMSDEKAWSIVLNSAKVDFNQAKTNFEALPGNIKKAVEDPSFLSELGSSSKFQQNKFKQMFIERYRNVIQEDYKQLNSNVISRLEFCNRNSIPETTIKALTGVTDLERIGTK